MILVTVGTNEQPFDRLVRAAAQIGGDEPLIVQYGSSREPHGRGTWIEFTSFEDLARLMAQARTVVCHAGVGSIMLARRCGKRPLVVPRRLRLREAVDDHQLTLARRLDASGIATLVEDEQALTEALAVGADADPAPPASPGDLPGAEELAGDVRLFLQGLVDAA